MLKEHFPDAPATNVPYIELPDGRFLVIDVLNDRIIRVFQKERPKEVEPEQPIAPLDPDESDEGAE